MFPLLFRHQCFDLSLSLLDSSRTYLSPSLDPSSSYLHLRRQKSRFAPLRTNSPLQRRNAEKAAARIATTTTSLGGLAVETSAAASSSSPGSPGYHAGDSEGGITIAVAAAVCVPGAPSQGMGGDPFAAALGAWAPHHPLCVHPPLLLGRGLPPHCDTTSSAGGNDANLGLLENRVKAKSRRHPVSLRLCSLFYRLSFGLLDPRYFLHG
jgi:hypothetical protein